MTLAFKNDQDYVPDLARQTQNPIILEDFLDVKFVNVDSDNGS